MSAWPWWLRLFEQQNKQEKNVPVVPWPAQAQLGIEC